MDSLFTNTKLGGITLKNPIIKTATYEGMYKKGLPTQDLIDHHVSMAKGGVGLTTVSYGAVSPEGKTFKDQMHINPDSLLELKKLAAEVHKEDGKVSIQLTHCGYFSKNTEISKPLAPSRIFNEYGFLSGLVFSKAMDVEDLEKVKQDFVNAAISLKNSGFDALEIHMGHGYLLSQFLSPATNKRKDSYGGTVEGRAKFPLEIFSAVKGAVGLEFPVLVKINLSDGFKGGFSEEDCIYVSKELEKRACDGIILSGGFTSKTPFYLLRGDVPLKGMIKNAESIAERITMAVFGPIIVKKYEFEANFFLDQAKRIRAEVSSPLVYIGGVDSKAGMEEVFEAGFEFIAIGRPLIHDSNFIQKIDNGSISKSECNRCNECIVEMDREGVKCVL